MSYTPENTAPTDLEARIGLPSLEALQYERRLLVKKIAPLETLFGSGGDRWTAKRRQHRDITAKQILAELQPTALEQGEDGRLTIKRTSDAALERMANADPRHVTFCEDTEARFADYMILKCALSEIEELIASREYTSRYLTAELRLQQ